MFKFLKNLFKKHNDVTSVVTVEDTTVISACKCGRKTIQKKHTKTKNSDGTLLYTFKISCPKCGREVKGAGTTLQMAKKNAIADWNKK